LNTIPQWTSLFIQQIDSIAVACVANASNLFRLDARFGQHLTKGAGGALPERFHVAFGPAGVGYSVSACNCHGNLAMQVEEGGLRNRAAVIDTQ
jgi:hypothetical protein